MLMLLALAAPLALFGLIDNDDDEESTVEQIGDAADNEISGGIGDDFIDGLAGDDVMNGRAGDDTIFGREGNDVLEGADGNDMLCSGEGEDVVTGNRGDDLIEGQGGDDWVSGDYGWDTVRGDEGNDTVLGGRGGDNVGGGEGDDLVFGGILQGVPLNLQELTELRDGGSLEEINGRIEMRDDSLGNTVLGGEGDDDLILGSNDISNGNEGNDTFHLMSERVGMDMGATINGFDADEDAITIIVDDVTAEIVITVTDEDNDAVIRSGDQILARLTDRAGAITAADITLIAESTVESLFDPNGAAA
jgi:Ca2+-binding RTX toxin-like protein